MKWFGRHPDSVIASNASNKATCSFEVRGKLSFFLERSLSTEEQSLSNGHWELVAVLHALQYKEADFRALDKDKRTIFWLTESTNMVTFLTKGFTKPKIKALIFQVFNQNHAEVINNFTSDPYLKERLLDPTGRRRYAFLQPR